MNDTTTTPTIPLLCRLNLRHHWHFEINPEDDHRYAAAPGAARTTRGWATRDARFRRRRVARLRATG